MNNSTPYCDYLPPLKANERDALAASMKTGHVPKALTVTESLLTPKLTQSYAA